MSAPQFPALTTLPIKRPSGLLQTYRTVSLRALRLYSPDPLDTAGSLETGGRYNAPKEFPEGHAMLYVAESTAVAHAEARVISVVALPGGGVRIQPSPNAEPRLDICVHLKLRRVLDLTDLAVQLALGLEPAALMAEWLPYNARHQLAPTQQLAHEAHQAGRFDAILYPSARYPGGQNYAVYPDIVPPAGRRIYDPGNEIEIFRRGR